MSKELIFIANEESRSKVSTVGRKESMFRESYAQAYDVLNTICENTKRYTEKNVKLSANTCCYRKVESSHDVIDVCDDLYNFYNNMIVFSARRGCGKTSAMLTFSRSLNCLLEKGEDDDPELIDKHNHCVKDRKFIVLSPIDPATLDETHDILSVILSRIFYYASQTWDNLCHPNDLLAKKENVIRYLRDCYSGVASLSSNAGKSKEWTLEELSQLSDSTILRKNMYRLMKSVIELRGYALENTQIVIQIDDADMNFECMYDILEKIRNYMIIPNVTILFAADIDLMWRIIYKKYWATLTNDGKNHLADDGKSAVELAEQYMLKCFPLKHRIHLKNLIDVLQQHRDRVYLRIDGDENHKVLRECYANIVWDWGSSDEEMLPPHTARYQLEYSLLRCLFRRTGMYFKQYDNYHYILPQTQRGFVHFVAMMGEMETVEHLDILDSYRKGKRLKEKTVPYLYYLNPTYDAGKKTLEIEKWLHNVNVFHDYFMSDWLQANLSAEEQDIIRGLAAEQVVDKNRYIIQKVRERLKLMKDDISFKNTFMELRNLLEWAPGKLGGMLSFAIRTYYALLTQIMILSDMKQFYEDKAWIGTDMTEPNSFDQLYGLYQFGFLPTFRMKKDENDEQYVNMICEKEKHLSLEWRNTYKVPDSDDPVHKEARIVSRLLTDMDGHRYNILSPLVNVLRWDGKDAIASEKYIDSYRRFQDACLSILASVDSQLNISWLLGEDIKVEQHEESDERYILVKAFYEHLLRETCFVNEEQTLPDSRLSGWLQYGLNELQRRMEDLAKAVTEEEKEKCRKAIENVQKSIEEDKNGIFGSLNGQ